MQITLGEAVAEGQKTGRMILPLTALGRFFFVTEKPGMSFTDSGASRLLWLIRKPHGANLTKRQSPEGYR